MVNLYYWLSADANITAENPEDNTKPNCFTTLTSTTSTGPDTVKFIFAISTVEEHEDKSRTLLSCSLGQSAVPIQKYKNVKVSSIGFG